MKWTIINSLNNPFDLFENLQRLKLSSNYLKELPINFLFHSRNSLISIDLQRNLFQSIPNLFGNIIYELFTFVYIKYSYGFSP